MNHVVLRRAGVGALLALPAILTVFLGFNAGGYYPGSVGAAAVLLGLALVLRIGLADAPLQGVSRWGVVVAVALTAFAGWTLASGVWSNAASRAVIEFDRALLYLLAFVLLGTVGWSAQRVRTALIGVAGAFLILALAGFASRTLPDLVSSGAGSPTSRLSYPLTYWNAEGLVCAFGMLLLFHLGSGPGPRVLKVAASMLIPLLGATLVLTLSRGAIGALILGLGVYVCVARERGVVFTALAVAPGTFAAVRAAYNSNLLLTDRFFTTAAQAQGQDLVVAVVLCCAATLVIRLLLSIPEEKVAGRGRLRDHPRLSMVLGAIGIVLLIAPAIALDAPGHLSETWDRFKASPSASTEQRDRLTEVSNNGRITHWNVAREAFARHRLRGTGAGTYQLLWAERRPNSASILDAHSLPLEVAAELGIVGVALLGTALAGLMAGLFWQARGPDRALAGVVAAAATAWLARACIDWDWEVPGVTLWLFALGGLTLARNEGVSALRPSRLPRILAMLTVSGLLLLPGQAARSQASLNDSVAAFRSGDCASAVRDGLSSATALPVRPEPLQILAFCDARLGQSRLSIEVARQAVRRDPRNWEFHYSLALVQGAAGTDPRKAAARALELNPREPLALDAVRRFETSNRRTWQSRARSAPLPFQGRGP